MDSTTAPREEKQRTAITGAMRGGLGTQLRLWMFLLRLDVEVGVRDRNFELLGGAGFGASF